MYIVFSKIKMNSRTFQHNEIKVNKTTNLSICKQFFLNNITFPLVKSVIIYCKDNQNTRKFNFPLKSDLTHYDCARRHKHCLRAQRK